MIMPERFIHNHEGPVIEGMGTALPERIIDNDEIRARFERFDIDPFLKIAGIRQRRIIAPGQSASDLAVCAAESILSDSSIDRSKIDTLICSTLTADYRTPPTACVLQDRLGLSENICTFDLVQACPALIHEMAVIHGFFATGISQNILVIHSDTLSQLINPRDRELVPIHGDGATAILYRKNKTDGVEFEWFEFGTNGTQAERVIVPEGMSRHPFTSDSLTEAVSETGNIRSGVNLRIDGTAVFHFVIHTIPKFLQKACERHKTSLSDYDIVLFHQANKLFLDMIYNMLRIPMPKRFYCLESVGNISGASLPFTLAEAVRKGRVFPGAKVLLCGFGAGLSWGAVSLRWQQSPCATPPTAILPGTGGKSEIT